MASQTWRLLSAAWNVALLFAVLQPDVLLAQNNRGPGRLVPVQAVDSDGKADSEREPFENVFLLPDRSLLQQLSKARELLKEERYGDAVRSLGAILDSPEDFFFQPDNSAPSHRSLKAEAQRLIGQMPERGLESYRLQFGARAERMLAEAVASGDTDRLAEVSRRFFHTPAGYEATFLLGRAHFEHARPLTAALTLQRLREAADGADPFEPALSLTMATCWLRSGMPEKAYDALRALKELLEQRGESTVMIAGKQTAMFAKSAHAADWLTGLVGPQHPAAPTEADRWAMHRGNPARNAASVGSAPLLNMRWEVPGSDDPALEDALRQLRQMYEEQEIVTLCGLHPLAVDDVVLMRTAQNLLAVDFDTGKRLWEVPVDDALERLLGKTSPEALSRQASPEAMALGERVWNDATYGTLSSDGRYVFSIEDLPLGAAMAMPGAPMAVVRGQRVPNGTVSLFNRLAARDIHTGKLMWNLGGPADPFALRQAETFFLGPPLPLMGQVYVLAESKGQGAIVLLALDAPTGNLVWSQPLAVVERDIAEDPLRRMSGVSPSYADGVLVCPTSSGAVVAVDLATRSLLWGYRYRRNDRAGRYQPFMGRRGTVVQPSPAVQNRWVDALATVADGRVLVTPIESDMLHCLSLTDGKLLWSVSRQDGLYAAGVYQDRVLVVGARSVRAFRLADGTSIWPDDSLALPEGTAPSGRGFLAGNRYFLPLRNAQVLAIDIEAGQIVRTSKSRKGNVPGNLICYKGKVLSQGFDGLETFYQSDAVRAEVDRRLAVKANDSVALSLRGEMLLDEDRQAEAIDCYRQAYRIDGGPYARALLRDALLDGLRLRFAEHRHQSVEIESLLDDPAQWAAYLRLMAGGLQQLGEPLAAFEHCLRLIDLDEVHRQMEAITPTLSVRRDRWIQAQLAALRSEVKDPEVSARIQSVIEARLQAAIEAGDAEPLLRFLDYFGNQPIAPVARRQLMRRLADSNRLLEAELALWSDQQSTDPTIAGPALAELAEMLRKAGRHEDAAACYRRLGGPLADVVCLEGKTGQQLVESLSESSMVRQLLRGSAAWPSGGVEIKHPPVKTARQPSYGRSPLQLDGSGEPFFTNTTVQLDPTRRVILGRDGWGSERWQVSLAEVTQQPNSLYWRSVTQGAVHGHLLLMSTGGKLLAIDALGSPEHRFAPRLLWNQDVAADGLGGMVQPFGLVAVGGIQGVLQPFGLPRSGGRSASIGPSTSRYVCFQRLRNLVAVDPLSGEVLWTVRNVPPGSQLFGDEEFIFAVPPDEAEALVFRAWDGYLLGKRLVPRIKSDEVFLLDGGVIRRGDIRGSLRYSSFARTCLATVGRRMLIWSAESDSIGRRRELQLFDPWQQRPLWPPRTFAAGAVAGVADDEVVGVCEPDGHFVLIALSDGRTLVDTQLPLGVSLSALTLMSLINSQDQYLLILYNPLMESLPGRGQRNIVALPGIPSQTIARGWVCAFDKQGRSLWPEPVKIENQCLPLDQPNLVPVLTFACQETVQQENHPERAPVQVSIVCLDKRTGRKLYSGSIPNTTTSFDIVGDPKQHTVELRMNQHTIALAFTDEPIRPEPDPTSAAGHPQTETPSEASAIGALGRAVGKALGLPLPEGRTASDKEK